MVGESPNHFGKPDRARRKDLLKDPKKFLPITNRKAFRKARISLLKGTMKLRVRGSDWTSKAFGELPSVLGKLWLLVESYKKFSS